MSYLDKTRAYNHLHTLEISRQKVWNIKYNQKTILEKSRQRILIVTTVTNHFSAPLQLTLRTSKSDLHRLEFRYRSKEDAVKI